MQKQEFNNGRIAIYQGDCFELLEQTENKTLDLCLIDPPYVYNDYSKGNKGFDEKKENIEFVKSISAGFESDKFFELIKEKLKFMNFMCFSSTRQVPEIMNLGLTFKKYQTNLLTWKKGGRPFGNTYLHDLEFVTHIRETGASFGGSYQSRVLDYISKRENGHPTEKPLALIKKLVTFGSNENDLIFDGFLGSGTTAIACHDLQRRLIACEIETKYFDLACKRLEEHQKQSDFFINQF